LQNGNIGLDNVPESNQRFFHLLRAHLPVHNPEYLIFSGAVVITQAAVNGQQKRFGIQIIDKV